MPSARFWASESSVLALLLTSTSFIRLWSFSKVSRAKVREDNGERRGADDRQAVRGRR